MNTLLYLCYGTGAHVQEARHSVLSALRFDADGDYDVVLYTDDPAVFADLPITTVTLSADELSQWAGPCKFLHRRKIMCIVDALQRYPGKVVLVDSDTFFKRSPRGLFDRIDQGTSCLHMREAKLAIKGNPDFAGLLRLFARHTFRSLSGIPTRVPVNIDMWNSGVIGVDVTNRHLVEEALHLTDQICQAALPAGRPSLLTEQISLTFCLAKTRLRAADDIIHHYWPAYQRQAFRNFLAVADARGPDESLVEFADRLIRSQPRTAAIRRLQMGLRVLLQGARLSRSGLRNSV